MIGSQYWTTGITAHRHVRGGWTAVLNFYDDGFCDNDASEGELMTRYIKTDPAERVRLLRGDAERLGIRLGTDAVEPCIYVNGMSEADVPASLKVLAEEWGWRLIADEEARSQAEPTP